MATKADSAMQELSVMFEKERGQPSKKVMENARSLYEQMGCEKETFAERETWDRCLNAKLFVKALTPVIGSTH